MDNSRKTIESAIDHAAAETRRKEESKIVGRALTNIGLSGICSAPFFKEYSEQKQFNDENRPKIMDRYDEIYPFYERALAHETSRQENPSLPDKSGILKLYQDELVAITQTQDYINYIEGVNSASTQLGHGMGILIGGTIFACLIAEWKYTSLKRMSKNMTLSMRNFFKKS